MLPAPKDGAVTSIPATLPAGHAYSFQMYTSPELQAADYQFWFFDEEAVTSSWDADRLQNATLGAVNLTIQCIC